MRGAKKNDSFPSFCCLKSSLMGMSVENSSVTMSDVAAAALTISER